MQQKLLFKCPLYNRLISSEKLFSVLNGGMEQRELNNNNELLLSISERKRNTFTIFLKIPLTTFFCTTENFGIECTEERFLRKRFLQAKKFILK